ncbi:hypothetical protein QL285_038691 [Trifolium repens]|nr:hypothetical protein QL285_038691 [Trifolium repens]
MPILSCRTTHHKRLPTQVSHLLDPVCRIEIVGFETALLDDLNQGLQPHNLPSADDQEFSKDGKQDNAPVGGFDEQDNAVIHFCWWLRFSTYSVILEEMRTKPTNNTGDEDLILLRRKGSPIHEYHWL